MIKPDYENSSIVNLMASILQGLGGHTNHHTPLPAPGNDAFERARNIVLLVIDGLGYNYLMGYAPRSILARHAHTKLTTVFPSTTATAITTFMTGLAPQQHGLTGWFTYFQTLESILTVLPASLRYVGGERESPKVDINALYGHTPVFDLLEADNFIVSPRHIAHSDYSLAHRGKATIVPYGDLTGCFSATRDIIQSGNRKKYIYTYWPEFDGLAHEKGVASTQVAAHFREMDAAFARFISDIAGTNTLVIATGDHGLIDSGPDFCLELHHHPRLLEALTMPLSGERRMAYCYVDPDRQATFLDYLTQTLADRIHVYRSTDLIEQHYFGLGPPHPDLHHRIGDYVLAMKGNYTVMDTLPGERHFYHIGTHGGMSDDEMWVPLILIEA